MQENNQFVRKRKTIFLRLVALVMPMVLLLLLSQTAFAQNTYVITDGDRVLVHTSAATDPATVLNEAGLDLDEDDTYTTQTGLGVSEITVQRSQQITVNNGGEILQINATEETVGQLLNRLDIQLEDGVQVSESLETALLEGMEITVSRTVTALETYTTHIPYETTYLYDEAIPSGTEVVVTPGKEGQLTSAANVVYVDGRETSRTVVEQKVVVQPVNEVISVGTGAEAPKAGELIIGDGTITLPTGEVLPFKDTMQVVATAYTHTDEGCDFITATGTTVRVGTVAVDPRLIPYGTRMFIIANDGSYVYGVSTAEDCGGSIKGNRVDLYYPTHNECIQFGVRDCTIYFLG